MSTAIDPGERASRTNRSHRGDPLHLYLHLETSLWWVIVAIDNGVIAVAYTAIAWSIARNLYASWEWRRNLLGTATAAIFVTCAVHHGAHTVHMVLPYFGVGVETGNALRFAMGHNPSMAVWDTVTAVVGVWYWGLRGRFPALVKGAAVFDDLKVREASERALRISEERYRRIVETTSEGVLTLDQRGRITYTNQRLAEMVGSTTEEMAGRPATNLVPAEEYDSFLARTRQQGRGGLHERYSTRLLHHDGHILHVDVSGTALYDELGRFDGSLAMITDVTEQRNLEVQFRQAQKLEAVGQLAGGVAHDFNNLLTVIDGYAAMLLDEVDQPARSDLEAIRAAAARAHGLTRQLLTFSRAQVTRPRDVAMNDIIVGIKEMLTRLIGEDIQLVTALTRHPAHIHVDQGQYEQALVNLVINARDAMPEGGKLTISTDVVSVAQAQAQQFGIVQGEYVVLAVSDTGVGMPPEVKSRVFEPFYTTKAPGKGTGLGLSTTYGIVRDAGGHVAIESEPGQGSTFRIYLPLVAEVSGAPTAAAPPDQEVIAGRGETILLVEDEPPVRELAGRVVRSAGYRVLTAANAEQALQVAEQAGHIDLLLTDVIMPGMNGRELAERLAAARPTLRVLFTSAYARGIIADRGILDSAAHYLEKPYTPAQLTRAIRTMLDAPASSTYGSAASFPR